MAPAAAIAARTFLALFLSAFPCEHGLAYAQEMSNRPQTLYGIEDSPIGLAAWMLDHDNGIAVLTKRGAGRKQNVAYVCVMDKKRGAFEIGAELPLR